MPVFVLLLFTFVIDLSLFCLYDEWLHGLPTSLSSMTVATWYLCVLYISLAYHKKTCFLLFELFDFAADEPPQRGVRTPIFLVPNVPEKFGTIQNVLHHSELIQIVLHHSVLRTIENVSKSQKWLEHSNCSDFYGRFMALGPVNKNQPIKKSRFIYVSRTHACKGGHAFCGPTACRVGRRLLFWDRSYSSDASDK